MNTIPARTTTAMTATTTSLLLPTHAATTHAAMNRLLDLVARIQDLDLNLQVKRLELAALLMQPCCTGTAHWRASTLYANHGIGQTCPMHGKPQPGKRLRVYVSKKPRKQKPVLDAIARQADASRVEAEYKNLFEELDTVRQLLELI